MARRPSAGGAGPGRAGGGQYLEAARLRLLKGVRDGGEQAVGGRHSACGGGSGGRAGAPHLERRAQTGRPFRAGHGGPAGGLGPGTFGSGCPVGSRQHPRHDEGPSCEKKKKKINKQLHGCRYLNDQRKYTG